MASRTASTPCPANAGPFLVLGPSLFDPLDHVPPAEYEEHYLVRQDAFDEPLTLTAHSH